MIRKLPIFICIIYVSLLHPNVGYSGGQPKIIETETGFVVEYTGEPVEAKTTETNSSEPKPTDSKSSAQLKETYNKTLEEIERIQRRLELKRESITRQQYTRNPSDDIKVSSISAMEMERSRNYITFSIKADVDNSGNRGEVSIRLVGKNRDGHQVDYVYLSGRIGQRESRSMTTTTMLNYQQAMDIRTWSVESVNKYE